MNYITDNLSDWLINSSIVLMITMSLMFFARKVLLSFNYSRTAVLYLWLAIPLALLCCLFAMNLVTQKLLINPVIFTLPEAIKESPSVISSIDWSLFLILIWSMVAIAKIVYISLAYLNLKARVLSQSVNISSNQYYTDLNVSPMALGLIKPIVIIPKYLVEDLSEKELLILKLHEQIHCNRSDPFWRFALEILCCLYWFLPLKSRVKQTLIIDQEVSCDQLVVEESQQMSTYAKLLLKLNLSLNNRNEYSSFLLCSSSFKLKERIMKLNQKQNNNHKKKIVSFFLLLTFTLSTLAALPQITISDEKAINLIPIKAVAPNYPRAAAIDKITGVVKLSFIVTTKGKVKDVKVIESSPGKVFVKEAVRAMKKWTFEPVAKDTQAQQTLKFALD